MSLENFEEFRKIVLEDLSLQERLRRLTEREEFVAFLIKTGAEHGFEFTAEDVLEAILAGRRAWIERWI